MANIFTKTMRQALQEARDYREENLNEKKADFLRLNFANNQTVKKVDRWAYNNLGHANQGFTSMIPDEHGKSIEWENIDDADGLMAKLKKAGFRFTVDMREAVKEGGPGSGPQFSSATIKKAYGILNDPRYKQGNYSGAAKAIEKLGKGLSSHPDVKNALKRANEGLDLSTTGATTASSTSQEIEEAADKSSAEYKAGLAAAEKGEKYDTNPHAPGRNRLNWSMGHNQFRADALRKAGKPNYGARGQFEETVLEGEELNEGRVIIATDKKAKKKWQFSGGMIVKFNGKQYKTEGVGMQQVLELTASFGSLKLGKKDIEDGFANGNFSVVNDGSVYQPWKN